MKWAVYINGDKSILKELSKTIKESDISIRERKGEYYLESTHFNKLKSIKEVKNVAIKIISNLCGAIKLFRDVNDPITYSYIESIDDNGKRTINKEVSGTITFSGSVTAKIIDSEGNIIPNEPTDDISPIVRLGLKDNNVSDALRLYGYKNHDWFNLYVLLEIVAKDVGDIDQIANNNWASKKEIRRFKHTSGSWIVLKDQARHASESTDPPPNPMSLPEARSLISEIIRMWLKSKIVK